MKKLILIITCVFLASCTTSSVKESKKLSASSVEFTVEENYQRVYKNLLDKTHECKGEVWAGESASYRIRDELFTELKEGHITFIVYNSGSQSYYIHTDITLIADNKTKAKVYIYKNTRKEYLPLIKQWALDGNSSCELSDQDDA
jgi:hypothetical protein